MIDLGGPVAYWVEGEMTAEMLEQWDGRGASHFLHFVPKFPSIVCIQMAGFYHKMHQLIGTEHSQLADRVGAAADARL